jgi:hypothetical protein
VPRRGPELGDPRKIVRFFFLEILKNKLKLSQWFHSRRVAPKKYDKPRTGNTSNSLSLLGQYGGTCTVPSFIEPVLSISYHSKRNSPEQKKSEIFQCNEILDPDQFPDQ